jgi:hypothetical protein
VLKREHSSAGICFTIPSVRLIVPTESVRGVASISKTLATTREMAMKLTSPAFANGAVIPKEYTADGRDISPPLSWSEVPAGTKTFALVCEDPDAPRGLWVHWGYFSTYRPARSRYLQVSHRTILCRTVHAGPQRFWADWLWRAFTRRVANRTGIFSGCTLWIRLSACHPVPPAICC